MSNKKKLGLGLATAALSLSLIGGGTYAYFNDTDTQTNTFASGTLDISVDPTTIVNVENLKPGDWMPRGFKLINDGSLDIGKVLLHTSYTVTQNGQPVSNPLANSYADAIVVDFLYNTGDFPDGPYEVIDSKSLLELRDMTPDDLAKELEFELTKKFPYVKWVLTDGIEAGHGENSSDNFCVQFRFKDTGVPQNELQDLDLELKWTFDGRQGPGEQR